MKLRYDRADLVFELSSPGLNQIVIESNIWLENIIIDFNKQINNELSQFCLLADSKELKISQVSNLITGPTSITFANNSVKKKLYNELAEDFALSDYVARFVEIESELLSLMDDIHLLSRYELSYADYLGVLDVLDLFKVKICEPEGKFVARLIEYIKVMNSLMVKKLFIIANCNTFIDYDDIRELKKTADYYEVCILLIDSSHIESEYFDSSIILDKDWCII